MCHEHLSPSTRQQSYVKSYLQPVSWLAALSITAPSQPIKKASGIIAMISPLTVAGAAAAYFHIYGTAFPFNLVIPKPEPEQKETGVLTFNVGRNQLPCQLSL